MQPITHFLSSNNRTRSRYNLTFSQKRIIIRQLYVFKKRTKEQTCCMEEEKEILTDLFNQYHTPLLNFCKLNGLTEAEAEDAVAETFCRLWTNYKAIEKLKPLQHKKWLYRTAKNVCYEKIRERIRIVDEDIEDIEFEFELMSHMNEIDILIEDQAFEVIKKQFLSELTDSEKYAFQIITDLNSGITYRELSKRYNISSSTLKSLAKRLRDKAKIILNNVFEK